MTLVLHRADKTDAMRGTIMSPNVISLSSCSQCSREGSVIVAVGGLQKSKGVARGEM